MDEIDRANEQAEHFRRVAERVRKPKGPKGTGFCLNCGADVATSRRWCDQDCRDEYEYLIQRGREV